MPSTRFFQVTFAHPDEPFRFEVVVAAFGYRSEGSALREFLEHVSPKEGWVFKADEIGAGHALRYQAAYLEEEALRLGLMRTLSGHVSPPPHWGQKGL